MIAHTLGRKPNGFGKPSLTAVLLWFPIVHMLSIWKDPDSSIS